MRLTEGRMMDPGASVSALVFDFFGICGAVVRARLGEAAIFPHAAMEPLRASEG